MTRVLVTGAAGFIGSHVVRHLQHIGHDVVGTDVQRPSAPLPGVRWLACDLRDPGAVRAMVAEARPGAVIHLGAHTELESRGGLADYAANVEGVEYLVAAIAAVGGVERTVCTSSQLVCRSGFVPSHGEDFMPSTLYGESKARTERIWRAHRGGGTTWCIVRPTTVWGARMNAHYLRFFQLLLRGRYWHVSGARRPRSFSYVGNLVHQYAALLDASASDIAGRVLYLADYEPLVLSEWADAFAAALEAPRIRTMPLPVARFAARGGDVLNALGARSFPFNSFRLGNVLGGYQADTRTIQRFCPLLPYTMHMGVDETAKWLREVLR